MAVYIYDLRAMPSSAEAAAPQTTRSSLGGHLRRLREARGLSFADVTRETRLPEHVLRHLERDELDALPGGSYARVYARTYAHALGADAEAVVESHATEFPDAPRPDTPPPPVPGPSGRSTLAPFVIAVLLIITVAVAVALLAGRRSPPPDQVSRAADGAPAGSYGVDRSGLA